MPNYLELLTCEEDLDIDVIVGKRSESCSKNEIASHNYEGEGYSARNYQSGNQGVSAYNYGSGCGNNGATAYNYQSGCQGAAQYNYNSGNNGVSACNYQKKNKVTKSYKYEGCVRDIKKCTKKSNQSDNCNVKPSC